MIRTVNATSGAVDGFVGKLPKKFHSPCHKIPDSLPHAGTIRDSNGNYIVIDCQFLKHTQPIATRRR